MSLVAWSNGDKLKHEKFRLPIRKNYFSVRIVKDQAQGVLCLLPWRSLEVKWAMAWAVVDVLWARVGLGNLKRSHPTLAVLLFSGFK